ncbi:MAG: type III-B CRISPR module-associated Cmr3 family protein, partial [Gallionellaceae bacterium]
QWASAGPFLAKREHGKLTPMFAKPADALYLLKDEKNDANEKAVYRLLPGEYDSDCGSDLPQGIKPVVAEQGAPKAKPQDGPAYWTLEQLLAWRTGNAISFPDRHSYHVEQRTHVAIDCKTLAADAGRIFQTQGLDFSARRKEKSGAQPTRGFEKFDWVFLARSAVVAPSQMVTFGGERRLSWLQLLADANPLALPDAHRKTMQASRKVSLTLISPALFIQGWQPNWPGNEVPGIPGLKLKLVSAAIDRWLSISGWDLLKGQAKTARKAVAAGATYWFEIEGEPPADWAEKLWLAPVSDIEQDRRDGFGIVIPGIWK